MAQPNVVPRHFLHISWFRVLASGFFLATAVKTGSLAQGLDNHANAMVQEELGISRSDKMMLVAALVTECMFCVASFVFAWFNMLGEASQMTRWACLYYSLIFDACVGAISATSHACEKYLVSTIRGPVPADSSYAIKRAFVFISEFFILRFFLKRRLSQARADADDWTKGHKPRSRPFLHLLQVAAAPFRFVWRCCCKFAHASRNPVEWICLIALCVIPIFIYWTVRITVKAFRYIVKGVKYISSKIRQCRSRRSAGRSTDNVTALSVRPEEQKTAADQVVVQSPGIGDSSPQDHFHGDQIEMATLEDQTKPMPPIVPPARETDETDICPLDTRTNNIVESTTIESRALSTMNEESAVPPIVAMKRNPSPKPQESREPRKRKRWRTKTTNLAKPGSTALERLLDHPTLFFELISQLHGTEFRALRRTSKTVNRILAFHMSEHPHTVKSYICSRGPDLQTILDAALTADEIAEAPSKAHSSFPCWACGVKICTECRRVTTKPLRVSKAELRLRMLQPVCSSCYFHCLCEPTFITDPETALQPRTENTNQPRDKIFQSMTTKCRCVAQSPIPAEAIPRERKSLCRDCESNGYQLLWTKRLKRGAIASDSELPASLQRRSANSNSNNDVSAATTAALLAAAQAAGISPASAGIPPATTVDEESVEEVQPETWSSRKGESALNIRTCHACKKSLWIYRDEPIGIRWWRCRKCGLEARDTLMSATREFLG